MSPVKLSRRKWNLNCLLPHYFLYLSPVCVVEDPEDLDEQVEDVQVKLDGGHDVVLGRDALHDHLGVEYYEACKIGNENHLCV
jgi:hypothetical protein